MTRATWWQKQRYWAAHFADNNDPPIGSKFALRRLTEKVGIDEAERILRDGDGFATALIIMLFKLVILYGVLGGVAAFLVSCSSAPLTKSGATQADIAQDQQRCAYEAEAATAAVENPVSAGVREAMLKRSCLAAKGWRR